MSRSIHILGGYGGAGRALARLLLREVDCSIAISGRNTNKAEAFCSKLRDEFPGKSITAEFADAGSAESLNRAFAGTDLVIMAATAPEFAAGVAEAAVRAGATYLDILVSGFVVDELQALAGQLTDGDSLMITQAGLHPGLIAPLIRCGGRQFDKYHRAVVGLAMNARFDSPSSAIELITDLADYQPRIVKGGSWEVATYRDMEKIPFGPPFGMQKCYPLEMLEIEPLQSEYQFDRMGVYVAGFNWFVDYLVFPLAVFLQRFRKGLGVRFSCRLLYHGINWFSPSEEAIELVLLGEGLKDGIVQELQIRITADDAYWLTAVPAVACIQQWIRKELPERGLHLMGQAVDPQVLFSDMEAMGLAVEFSP